MSKKILEIVIPQGIYDEQDDSPVEPEGEQYIPDISQKDKLAIMKFHYLQKENDQSVPKPVILRKGDSIKFTYGRKKIPAFVQNVIESHKGVTILISFTDVIYWWGSMRRIRRIVKLNNNIANCWKKDNHLHSESYLKKRKQENILRDHEIMIAGEKRRDERRLAKHKLNQKIKPQKIKIPKPVKPVLPPKIIPVPIQKPPFSLTRPVLQGTTPLKSQPISTQVTLPVLQVTTPQKSQPKILDELQTSPQRNKFKWTPPPYTLKKFSIKPYTPLHTPTYHYSPPVDVQTHHPLITGTTFEIDKKNESVMEREVEEREVNEREVEEREVEERKEEKEEQRDEERQGYSIFDIGMLPQKLQNHQYVEDQTYPWSDVKSPEFPEYFREVDILPDQDFFLSDIHENVEIYLDGNLINSVQAEIFFAVDQEFSDGKNDTESIYFSDSSLHTKDDVFVANGNTVDHHPTEFFFDESEFVPSTKANIYLEDIASLRIYSEGGEDQGKLERPHCTPTSRETPRETPRRTPKEPPPPLNTPEKIIRSFEPEVMSMTKTRICHSQRVRTNPFEYLEKNRK